MGVLTVLQNGKTGMAAAQAGIATSGHNISNANTEGYSRQRVTTEAKNPNQASYANGSFIGNGVKISNVSRINDSFLERQIRDGSRELAYHDEKQLSLGQIEEVFNEMDGDGLNRIVARFFNDFRRLSNEPSNEALKQAVRESSIALSNDFKRIRNTLVERQSHIDSKLEGQLREFNDLADRLRGLNVKIHDAEISGREANDLHDQRDLILKRIGEFTTVSVMKDSEGMMNVNIPGIGPLVTGPNVERFHYGRGPADLENGSPENSIQIRRSPHAKEAVTHLFKGGKLGAMIEVRDQSVQKALERLDRLAHGIANSVNDLHVQGYSSHGAGGNPFFKPIMAVSGAASNLNLSDAIRADARNIATGYQPDAPGDNRMAQEIANLQNVRIFDGQTTFDDFYNGIVSDVGIASQRAREAFGQQKGIVTQMGKMREQLSGVSVDEEVTNLMQWQHAFDASAKVIKIADDMYETILGLRR